MTYIARMPESFRYRVIDFGLRVALFFGRTIGERLLPHSRASFGTCQRVNYNLQRLKNLN